jgi:hypothetical protein
MVVADWLRNKLTGATCDEGIPDTSPSAERPLWMRDGMRAMEVFGYDRLRVVGLPGYREMLWSILGQDVHALLVAEHGNPFDRNAVAVWLGGQRVGRLTTDDSGRLRPGLIRLQRQHRRAVALPGRVDGDRTYGLGMYLTYDASAFGV